MAVLSLPSLLLASLAGCGFASRQGNYSSVANAFPQLNNLYLYPPSNSRERGHQNFTHCCLLAVNASLICNNGVIEKTPGSFIQGGVDEFIDASERGQFPCGATFDGNASGAPVVEVPYKWLVKMCPGWELVQPSEFARWTQPLAGFVLPAIVFCKRVLDALAICLNTANSLRRLNHTTKEKT